MDTPMQRNNVLLRATYGMLLVMLLAAASADCEELAKDKADFIRCAARLKDALSRNKLGEKISFGYIDYEGGISLIGGEQLLVKGNGEVALKKNAFFIDEVSRKCALSSIEYHYNIDEYSVREICEEFLKSGFFEKKFIEERTVAPPETPYMIIFLTLDDVKCEKEFIIYLDIDLVRQMHKEHPWMVKEGVREDGAGLPKALERLQYLLYIVAANHTRDRAPKGSVYNREDESMPRRIDFNKNQ
jgi:hypothetical protein